MGKIVTFYSYKGGVGRSMAMANIAVLLSKWGFKILIVDFDLEAPGLQYFFREFIEDFKNVGQKPGILNYLNLKSENIEINWKDYVVKILMTDDKIDGGFNEIDLLMAGNKDNPSYIDELQKFNADVFYNQKNGGLIIEDLRDAWKEEYDFVLIDSRTGMTDIGGICTIQFPDILVALFTATLQGWDGIKETIEKIVLNQNNLPLERERLIVLPIPTRID